MIYVGRKDDPGAEYIGRPSPLGNPFSHKKDTIAQFRVKSVDEALALYHQWLIRQVKDGNQDVLNELKRLKEKHAREGDLVLGCWCAPNPCHGDIIKKFLDL